jgi:hypothetical protein
MPFVGVTSERRQKMRDEDAVVLLSLRTLLRGGA